MTTTHTLGFPRFGRRRELKKALERYWRGDLDRDALLAQGQALRARHWREQADAGIDLLPVGDFSYYDGVLDMTTLLGALPERFGHANGEIDLDTYFRMARGRAPRGADVMPCEMTKWFDTNYHYIVPELTRDQRFYLASNALFDEVEQAQALGHRVKPTLIGPVSYLWLGKATGGNFDKLVLLEALLPVYREILGRLASLGVEWVQLDEPILATELPSAWQQALQRAHATLSGCGVRRMIATYFGPLHDNRELALSLDCEGLHVDVLEAPSEIASLALALDPHRVLSAGVIDGRNVWTTDLHAWLPHLEEATRQIGERLWVAPSCSLLHVPVDTTLESRLDDTLRAWLAFAVQKLQEVVTLSRALTHGRASVADRLQRNQEALAARRSSERTHQPGVRARTASIDATLTDRGTPYAERAEAQQRKLGLPSYPTTTIGSFPQTAGIRKARRAYRTGESDLATYQREMRAAIEHAVRRQEAAGLDVLAHGEPERNDMVEYFGELLDGFCFTEHGWVQSFGSRGVKPPIIFGDVARPAPMTLPWSRYAQSLTDRPMKAMLTGPVTLLQWSFVRDDQPRAATCEQIALALRDEVLDLESAGLHVIQVDEPAFREGLPLRRSLWPDYLTWATRAFRLAMSGVSADTQIHTHMCYSEFNDIIDAIANLDADVITIETSRSRMTLLDAFVRFQYPNEIGPGVYDIHSPRLTTREEMVALLEKARELIPAERLWVNPDCGLKTRDWDEVEPALANMVAAARTLRARL